MKKKLLRAAAFAALLLGTSLACGADGKGDAEKAQASAPEARVAADTPAAQLALRLSPLTAEDLAAEAQAWQALLKAKTQELVELQIALSNAAGDEAKRINEAIVAKSTERRSLSAGLATVIDAWEAKGGEADKVEPFRRYVRALEAEQLKGTRASTALAELEKWLTAKDGGLALLAKIAVALFAVAALWTLAGIVAALVKRSLSRVANVSALLRAFAARAAFWAVLAAGLLVVLGTLGVNVGGLLALVGGASFVLAFAMQSTLSNFAAGLMIMIYRPFDVGDHVEVAGVAGRVESVSLVSTTITTPDNRLTVIPNGSVWGSVITNATGSETRRVDLAFTLGRDEAAHAQRILEEVIRAHPGVLPDPAPVVRLQEFGDSSVRFSCEAWARTSDYWTVHWDLTRAVMERFDADRIAGAAKAAG